MKLSGVFVCLILLQSCGAVDQSFNETSGFTQKQLESGIALTFSTDAFSKVKNQRNEALEINYHFKQKNDFVPVLFSCGNHTINVKARLKGGEVDHLSGNFWSFKLKGKTNLGFGQKKLAIQSPHTKNYLREYLFHQLCQQEGLISLPYFFVPVAINDSLKSTYAMVSVIGLQTVLNGGRKAGPVLKFDKKAYWKRMMKGESGIDSLSMLSAPIKSCDAKWAKKNKQVHAEAVVKLSNYRRGNSLPKEVFDYDLYARYVALSELLGSSHNLRWLNLRLYFNPETKKFEPIAFDCYDGQDPRNEAVWYQQKQRFEYFLHPLLNDLDFQKKVEAYLKVYCQKQYVKSIFSDHHNEITRYMKLIRIDCPGYLLSRDQMLRRAKHILNTVSK
jgi:hypothetical protein